MITQLLHEVYQVNQGQSDALDHELSLLIANIEKEGVDNIPPESLATIVKLRKKLHKDIVKQKVRFDKHNAELLSLESLSTDPLTDVPLNKNDVSTGSLLRQVILVLENYRAAVKALEHTSKVTLTEQFTLFDQHKKSFIDLYQDIHVNIAHKPQLQKLHSDLNATVNIDELLRNSKELIALLLKNINNEKETSEYFLQALNEALSNVKQIVDESSDQNNSTKLAREKWDLDIHLNVDNIQRAVDDGSDTISLKKRISKEISNIVKAMAYKQQFDQQEHEKLAQQLKSMAENLSKVEAQAQDYKSQLDQQKQLNLTDPLTKLPNRSALNQRFKSEFQKAKDYDKPLWVVVADIDHFKRINDTYGHNAGDKTLQVIASAISRSLRGSEFIARYGGEEFVFLIPLATKVAVDQILNRVRENVKAIPFKFKQKNLTITISLGATKVRLEDQSPESTFERADQALYKAKNSGRDQVVIK